MKCYLQCSDKLNIYGCGILNASNSVKMLYHIKILQQNFYVIKHLQQIYNPRNYILFAKADITLISNTGCCCQDTLRECMEIFLTRSLRRSFQLLNNDITMTNDLFFKKHLSLLYIQLYLEIISI